MKAESAHIGQSIKAAARPGGGGNSFAMRDALGEEQKVLGQPSGLASSWNLLTAN